MSQSDFGTIDPNTKSGDALASDLNNWRTAVHSSHKGSTAPSYKVVGMAWLDDTATPWILKMYDGADWIPTWAINATTNQAYPISSAGALNYPLAGGTANALTLTPAPAITAYNDLDTYSFEAAANNTAAATMNISSVGAKAIRKIVAGADVALAAGDILDGVRYVVNYDPAANAAAGAWILVNPSGAYATLTGTETLSNKTLVSPKIQDATLAFTYNFIPSSLAANRNITLPALAGNDTLVLKANDIQATATWQAGVGTIESLITPAKLAAAINSLAPNPPQVNYQAFTASGTWTKPAGGTANSLVLVHVVGAGGAGGAELGGFTEASGGGGGGGAFRVMKAGDLPATVAVTIPSGTVTSARVGGTGGQASFGSYVIAYGGGGGNRGPGNNQCASGGSGGGLRGAGSTGVLNGTSEVAAPDDYSGYGGYGFSASNNAHRGGDGTWGGGGGGGSSHSSSGNVGAAVGGISIWGGGGGGGYSNATGAAGGDSVHGGDGGVGGSGGVGGNGVAPGGGGGGGGGSDTAGGNGARGEVRVWWIP